MSRAAKGLPSPPARLPFDLTLTHTVWDGDPIYLQVGLDFGLLSDQTGTPITFDFSTTAGLRFVLPEGTAMTSSSGVLPIPEPGTLALCTLGLAGLGYIGRRSARTQRGG